MSELLLRYGVNPHQAPARVHAEGGLPFEVLNGSPGYINLLDALNAWQLVQELAEATGLPAAASFKHVSPAGAAVGTPLGDSLRAAYLLDPSEELTPLACAYARARGADAMSSFGDCAALSEPCDLATARLLKREVSDIIIAPGFAPEALELLRAKKGGKYVVLRVDPDYRPPAVEMRQVFGVTFEQPRNDIRLDESLFANIVTQRRDLPAEALRDLLVASITLKYTQSNSVCYAFDGQVIGNGAGQQSRVHCTRLAGDKADLWFLRQHPKALGLAFEPGVSRAERNNRIESYVTDLSPSERRDWLDQQTGVALSSDAFFPFRDNLDRAAQSGVAYVVEPGGSVRDDEVIAAADEHGMVMAFSGVRLFHH